MSFEVRLATPNDLEEVVQLAAAVEKAAHWDITAFQSHFEEDEDGFLHRVLLVAVEGERVIGFAAASWLFGDAAAELLNLAVEESFRRRGMARSLCAAVATWVEGLGVHVLELEVRVSNARAVGLYAHLGFVEVGKRPKYYQHPTEDALLMRWMFPGK